MTQTSPNPSPAHKRGGIMGMFRSPGRRHSTALATPVSGAGDTGSGGSTPASGASDDVVRLTLPQSLQSGGGGGGAPTRGSSRPALSRYLNAMEHEEKGAVTPGGESRGWHG